MHNDVCSVLFLSDTCAKFNELVLWELQVDISTMLEEAVQYVKFLQLQIKVRAKLQVCTPISTRKLFTSEPIKKRESFQQSESHLNG